MPEINNGHTEPSSPVEVGETVRVVCEEGWEIDMDSVGSATPACTDECTFEAAKRCKRIQCPLPSDRNGFLHNGETMMAFGDTITVTCNTGFMRTSSPHLDTEPDDPCYISYFQTCLANGTLTNTQYSCERLQCHSPSLYDRDYLTCRGLCGAATGEEVAVFSPDPNVGTAYLGTVNVACNAGYEWNQGVASSNELKCEWACMFKPDVLDGCWPMNCPLPPYIPNAQNVTVPLPHRNTMTRSCLEGFIIQSSGEACAVNASFTCALSGTEVQIEPVGDGIDACVPATCPAMIPTYENTNMAEVVVTSNAYGGEAVVPCDDGHIVVDDDPAITYKVCSPLGGPQDDYTLEVYCGTALRPCTWGTRHKKCVPSVCSVDPIANGRYLPGDAFTDADNNSFVFYATTAALLCDTGFRPSTNVSETVVPHTVDRELNLLCRPWCSLLDGQLLPATCKPVTCPAITTSTGKTLAGANGVAGKVLQHGEMFQYQCGGGRVPVGTTSTTCDSAMTVTCTDGTLVGEVACVQPVCGNGCENACPAGAYADPNGDASSWAEMPHGTARTVQCNTDYKAALVDADPTCDDPDFYEVTCDKMCPVATRVCKPKACYCTLDLSAANNYADAETRVLAHGTSFTATCDPDFRVAGAADECALTQVVTCTEGVSTLQPCIEKPCACNATCPSGSWSEPNGRAPGISADEDQRVEHGVRDILVTCDTDYAAWPLLGEDLVPGTLPHCNDTITYLVDCFQCEFQRTQSCQPMSCGVYDVKLKNSQLQSPMVEPAGHILKGQTVTVTCNNGYTLGGDGQTTTGVSVCQADCTFSPLGICEPISCGDYTVPGNAFVQKYADNGATWLEDVTTPTVELFHGMQLKVTCDIKHRLASSNVMECGMEDTVTCNADGTISNGGVQCQFQPCRVTCTNGTRYAGPEGVSSGCTLEGKCPVTAPDVWMDDAGCSSRVCNEIRECTEVRCRPYIPPVHGTVMWPAGEGELSTWVFEDELTVSCNVGYMPEGQMDMMTCVDSFTTTCLETGYWSTIQTCVPKMCHASYGNHTWAVPFNTSYTIPCPAGHVAVSTDPSTDAEPMCQADCTMTHGQTCAPHTCLPYNHSGQHTVEAVQTTVCDQTINVTCLEGYISTWSFQQGSCLKQYHPMCTINRTFDHEEPGQCRIAQCPAYTSVDPNAVATLDTARESPWGTAVMVTCKENFGPSGRYSAEPLMVTCGAGDADERACEWSGERCQPIQCSVFEVANDGGACIAALQNDGKCDAVNNNTFCGYDAGECLGNVTTINGPHQLSLVASDSMRIQCTTGHRVSNMNGTCDKEFVVSCSAQGELVGAHTCETVTCPSYHDTLLAMTAGASPTEWMAYPFAKDDRVTTYQQELELMCLDGNEYDPSRGGAATVRCQDDCTLTEGMQCMPITCDNHLLDFDTDKNIVLASTAELGAEELAYGAAVSIECEAGHELVTTHDGVVAGLEEFGEVRVLQRARFPVPSAEADTTFTMPGDFDFLDITVPRGAWNNSLGPSATVFEVPAQFRSDDGGEAVLAGEAISFGPEGATFGQQGVEIELPLNETEDFGNRQFEVRFWESQSRRWLARETLAVKRVGVRRAVRGRVYHFSTYAAFAVPALPDTPAPPPANTPSTENPATEGEDDDNTGWIIGGVVGGVLVLLLLLALCVHFNKSGDGPAPPDATVVGVPAKPRAATNGSHNIAPPQPAPVPQPPMMVQQQPVYSMMQPTVMYQGPPPVQELPDLPQPVPELPPLPAFQSPQQTVSPGYQMPAAAGTEAPVFFDDPWDRPAGAWPIGDPTQTGVVAMPPQQQPLPTTYVTQPPYQTVPQAVNYASQTSVVDPNFQDPNTM